MFFCANVRSLATPPNPPVAEKDAIASVVDATQAQQICQFCESTYAFYFDVDYIDSLVYVEKIHHALTSLEDIDTSNPVRLKLQNAQLRQQLRDLNSQLTIQVERKRGTIMHRMNEDNITSNQNNNQSSEEASLILLEQEYKNNNAIFLQQAGELQDLEEKLTSISVNYHFELQQEITSLKEALKQAQSETKQQITLNHVGAKGLVVDQQQNQSRMASQNQKAMDYFLLQTSNARLKRDVAKKQVTVDEFQAKITLIQADYTRALQLESTLSGSDDTQEQTITEELKQRTIVSIAKLKQLHEGIAMIQKNMLREEQRFKKIKAEFEATIQTIEEKVNQIEMEIRSADQQLVQTQNIADSQKLQLKQMLVEKDKSIILKMSSQQKQRRTPSLIEQVRQSRDFNNKSTSYQSSQQQQQLQNAVNRSPEMRVTANEWKSPEKADPRESVVIATPMSDSHYLAREITQMRQATMEERTEEMKKVRQSLSDITSSMQRIADVQQQQQQQQEQQKQLQQQQVVNLPVLRQHSNDKLNQYAKRSNSRVAKRNTKTDQSRGENEINTIDDAAAADDPVVPVAVIDRKKKSSQIFAILPRQTESLHGSNLAGVEQSTTIQSARQISKESENYSMNHQFQPAHASMSNTSRKLQSILMPRVSGATVSNSNPIAPVGMRNKTKKSYLGASEIYPMSESKVEFKSNHVNLSCV